VRVDHDARARGVAPAQGVDDVTVTPSVDLVDLQTVTVSATGLEPATDYRIPQCQAGATNPSLDCGLATGGFATTDATGAFTATVTVRRAIFTSHTVVYDCVATPGACMLAVTDIGVPGVVLASAPITFDPSVPPPPVPSVTVVPADDLVDGQEVDVTAGGLVAGETVAIVQCQVDSTDSTHCTNAQLLNADPAGEVHTGMAVRRIVAPTGEGGPFDCASAPGSCAIFVHPLFDAVRTNWVPLSFDPSGSIPADSIAAAPLVDLVDGQVVTITVFSSTGGSFGSAQCRADVTPPEALGCDQSTASLWSTDPSGQARRDVAVRRVLRTPDGEYDCSLAPGRCVIVVADIDTLGEVARFPLAFRVDTSAPAVSVPARPRFTG
jgi:hypothetical protein